MKVMTPRDTKKIKKEQKEQFDTSTNLFETNNEIRFQNNDIAQSSETNASADHDVNNVSSGTSSNYDISTYVRTLAIVENHHQCSSPCPQHHPLHLMPNQDQQQQSLSNKEVVTNDGYCSDDYCPQQDDIQVSI